MINSKILKYKRDQLKNKKENIEIFKLSILTVVLFLGAYALFLKVVYAIF